MTQPATQNKTGIVPGGVKGTPPESCVLETFCNNPKKFLVKVCHISAIKFLHRWLGFITCLTAGVILAVMTILVFLTIIYRYILLAPISWGEEMSRFLFIALCIFGAAIAMKERTHFAITMLTDKFPSSIRPRLEVGVALATSVLLSVVIYRGWGLVLLNRNEDSPALGVNMISHMRPFRWVPC